MPEVLLAIILGGLVILFVVYRARCLQQYARRQLAIQQEAERLEATRLEATGARLTAYLLSLAPDGEEPTSSLGDDLGMPYQGKNKYR